jgi:hypothetical protein
MPSLATGAPPRHAIFSAPPPLAISGENPEIDPQPHGS